MDVLVLNTEFETVDIIDYYVSLIWTERYAEAGDFELYLRSDSRVLGVLKQGYYLWMKNAEMTMIVESIQINTDIEDGNEFIITGRSLESILDRRIIWPQTNLDGYLVGQVIRLIKENIINPTDSSRKIGLFYCERKLTQTQYNALSTAEKNDGTAYTVIDASSDKEAYDLSQLQLRAQYTGDNLYDTIVAICAAYNLGFKVKLTPDNRFRFSLYKGADRSYDQETKSYVVFSTKFDNLISSNYSEETKDMKTVAVVAGEGEGTDRRNATVESDYGAGTGLGRRELFVDARDISSTSGSTQMTNEAYNEKLLQRGREKLAECLTTTSFEGEVEDGQTFSFGKDYFIGDIVQLVDEYKRDATVRVTELIRSVSTSGIEIYPTFVSTYKATITISGNVGDSIVISGTGYGYAITIGSSGKEEIIITATGDYTFVGSLTGVEKTVSASTNKLAYSVDLTFVATVVIRANPSTNVGIASLTDSSVTYVGKSAANGLVSFTVYRIGEYQIVTDYTPEEDEDGSSYNSYNAPIALSSIPESVEEVDADYKGNVYNVNTVYVANFSSISSTQVNRDNASAGIYIYWDEPEQLYEGLELYVSEKDYPEEPDSTLYTKITEGYGTKVNISDYTGEKLTFTVTGLVTDTTYYYAAWPYITIDGTRYYGSKKTTTHTISST